MPTETEGTADDELKKACVSFDLEVTYAAAGEVEVDAEETAGDVEVDADDTTAVVVVGEVEPTVTVVGTEAATTTTDG